MIIKVTFVQFAQKKHSYFSVYIAHRFARPIAQLTRNFDNILHTAVFLFVCSQPFIVNQRINIYTHARSTRAHERKKACTQVIVHHHHTLRHHTTHTQPPRAHIGCASTAAITWPFTKNNILCVSTPTHNRQATSTASIQKDYFLLGRLAKDVGAAAAAASAAVSVFVHALARCLYICCSLIDRGHMHMYIYILCALQSAGPVHRLIRDENVRMRGRWEWNCNYSQPFETDTHAACRSRSVETVAWWPPATQMMTSQDGFITIYPST